MEKSLWNGANESAWWIESNGMNATGKGLHWFNYCNVIYRYLNILILVGTLVKNQSLYFKKIINFIVFVEFLKLLQEKIKIFKI